MNSGFSQAKAKHSSKSVGQTLYAHMLNLFFIHWAFGDTIVGNKVSGGELIVSSNCIHKKGRW